MEEFTIIEILDGGPKHIEEKGLFRLACLTDNHERLVIWGSHDNTNNLKAVSGKKPPFVIACEFVEPESRSAAKYGDAYWVNEDDPLAVIG